MSASATKENKVIDLSADTPPSSPKPASPTKSSRATSPTPSPPKKEAAPTPSKPLKRKRETETNGTDETPKKKKKAPAATAPTIPASDNSRPTPQLASTNTKPPALAPRYIPSYVSTTSTHLRNPMTFTVKPPFWTRWPSARYTALISSLRAQFDPIPFATAHSLSVEEVQNVFTALVCEPIYESAEKVKVGVEAHMQRVIDAVAKRGEPFSVWTARVGGGKVRAELAGVRPGVVELIAPNGGLVEVRWAALSDGDQERLEERLTEGELGCLRGE